jgi:hypothetical protein
MREHTTRLWPYDARKKDGGSQAPAEIIRQMRRDYIMPLMSGMPPPVAPLPIESSQPVPQPTRRWTKLGELVGPDLQGKLVN